MCTLDSIKVFIYEFRYDYIKNKYGKNLRLLFTDTNSLLHNLFYEIKTEDVYEDFSKTKEIFRF